MVDTSASAPLPPLSADSIPEHLIPREEWYETWLRYALYAGAAFQLVCILAVLVLPPRSGQGKDEAGQQWEEVQYIVRTVLLLVIVTHACLLFLV